MLTSSVLTIGSLASITCPSGRDLQPQTGPANGLLPAGLFAALAAQSRVTVTWYSTVSW